MATARPLQTDEEEVLAANQAFYQALEGLELAEMGALWLHEDWVRCLHPGWELLVGWDDVRESWDRIFRSTDQMRVSISRPVVRVQGDAAWVSCIENVTTAFEEGFSTAVVEATNIFVRRAGVWRLVHHHTTPMPGRVPSGVSQSVQ